METTNLPLILRMSPESLMQEKPLLLLTRMSTLPLQIRKRKREFSNELNESLRSDRLPKKTPNLLSRLSIDPSESEMKLRTFLTNYPEENLTEMRANSESLDDWSGRMKCLGTTPLLAQLGEPAVSKPVKLCYNSAKTYQESNHSFELLTIFLKESPLPSGIDYSVENPSTSIKSSLPCTLSNLMKRERDAWDQLKSCLQQPSPSDRSKLELNVHQLSGECRKELPFSSLTIGRNSLSMPSTSKDFSLLNIQTATQRSSFMTNQSVTRLEEDRISYSPTITDSTVSAKQFSMPMVSSTRDKGLQSQEVDLTKGAPPRKISAEGLTSKEDVVLLKRTATTNTFAKGAEGVVTERLPVLQ